MQTYQLIGVPFDGERYGERMGATPSVVLPALAKLPLNWAGAPVSLAEALDPGDDLSLRDVVAELADAVRTAKAKGALPIIIGGDCMTAFGAVGGLAEPTLGIVWIDAHGDFNTPEISISGYLGGMPLAGVTGRCLAELRDAAAITQPVAEAQVVLLGVRDLDPLEQQALDSSTVEVFTTVQLGNAAPQVGAALERVGQQGPVYLHIDVDVLDPSVLPGAIYSVEQGLKLGELLNLVDTILARCAVAGVALTAFNPTPTNRDSILAVAGEIVKRIGARQKV